MVTTTYTDETRVAALLNLMQGGSRLVFSASTIPTQAEVQQLIVEIEDYIDSITGTTWKETQVTDEYHDFDGVYIDKSGNELGRLNLKNWPVKSFSAASGDKIEIWDGSEWVDLVSSKTVGTNPYDEDYFVDTDKGVIYFITEIPMKGQKTVRLTYRWGFSTVPEDIKHAATLLAAARILERHDAAVIVAEGEEAPNVLDQVRVWQEMADRILKEHAHEDFVWF